VFRSNDNVPIDFYVDSRTVLDASPVLRFRTAQLGTPTTGLVRPVNLVQIDESADSIEAMLRLIYPHVRKPQITTSEDLDHLLSLCKRYQIAHSIHFLCARYLQALARTEPLRAYGLACKHDLPAEIKYTSRETLRIDLSKADVSRDLAECHSEQIKALVHLHSRRAATAIAIISNASVEELTCPGEYCEDGVAEWWLEVVKRSRTELKARPTTDTLFSPAFLAGCCRVASKRCRTCPDQYLSSRAQHKLGCIKDEIDALPFSL